jgi:SAM-dependent methyltransferase
VMHVMTHNTLATAGLSFGARTTEYKTFRLQYPPSLFERIFAALPAERRGLAVDLGSGTGIATLPLLERFDRVIAVEPDARMSAANPVRERFDVITSKAEEVDLPVPAHAVDLVTCGTAFYWMDGPHVIARVAQWLVPDGLLAVFRYALPQLPAPVAMILDREMTQHWQPFRHPRLIDEEYSWRTIASSPLLHDCSLESLPYVVQLTAASFVGFFASTSYVGAWLKTCASREDYLAGLQDEVEAAVGPGEFEASFPTELILARPRGGASC